MKKKVKEVKKLSRIRIGSIPSGKVIHNKKRNCSRKNKYREIEEQLEEYYNGD